MGRTVAWDELSLFGIWDELSVRTNCRTTKTIEGNMVPGVLRVSDKVENFRPAGQLDMTD